MHGQPGVVESDRGAEPGQDVAELITGLVGPVGPVRHGHGAAGDRRGGQERRGVGEIGLDVDVERRDLAGGDHPAVGFAVVDRRRRDPAASPRSCRCAAATARPCRHVEDQVPGRTGPRRAAAPTTNWLEAEASTVITPPGRSARPVSVNGSVFASAGTPAPQSPQGVQQHVHRPPVRLLVGVEGHLARRQRGDRGHEPHHGPGQAAVDGAAGGEGAAAARPATRRPSSVILTPRARRASRISRVSRASSPYRIVEGPLARAARISARLVSDLEPGTDTVARIGAWARGAGQGVVAVTVTARVYAVSSSWPPPAVISSRPGECSGSPC